MGLICTLTGNDCERARLTATGPFCYVVKLDATGILKTPCGMELRRNGNEYKYKPLTVVRLVENKEEGGKKYDAGKTDWSLLPLTSVEEIIKVLEFGAYKKNYGPENWQKLPDFRTRYINAAFRHLSAYAKGETKDPESGLSHMAHLGCNVLFLLWKELQEESVVNKD